MGDLQGKNVLEIGCGSGQLAVCLAKLGAQVTATDFSGIAVEKTCALAEVNGVASHVTAYQADALALDGLGRRFDLVVGRFILHHIEPFRRFVEVLGGLLVPGGRGIFLENNARNPLLMLARSHLTGRLGIPRYGDNDEHPFEPREAAMLAEAFDKVEQLYPALVCFQKLNTYVWRQNPRFTALMNLNKKLDRALYARVPRLRKYSYNQVVTFVQPAPRPSPARP